MTWFLQNFEATFDEFVNFDVLFFSIKFDSNHDVVVAFDTVPVHVGNANLMSQIFAILKKN